MSEINVVPYIDVMLVLLVIFIVTAPLLSQGVHVELPRKAATPIEANPEGDEPIVLSIDADGAYYINYGDHPNAPVEPRELLRRVQGLHRYKPATRFYVRGDRDVRYEEVVSLMVLLQEAGIEGVGLMTRPPPDRG